MDPLIVPSGHSLIHLRPQLILASRPAFLQQPLVVDLDVLVRVPAVSHRHRSHTFHYTSWPNAMPYNHWQQAVEQMILTAASHYAPALHFANLVLDFSSYTYAASVRLPASPGHVLFLSAVIEVDADNPPPRHLYYFPFPGAQLHVAQAVVDPVTPAGYRFDGGTPASASPIRSMNGVIFGGEAAAAKGDDGESSCAICLQEYKAADVPRELLCGHRFHPYCIGKWLRKRRTCPLCRRPVPLDHNCFVL